MAECGDALSGWCVPELTEPLRGLLSGGTALAGVRVLLEGEGMFIVAEVGVVVELGFDGGAPQVVHAEAEVGAGEGEEVYWGTCTLANGGKDLERPGEGVHALSCPTLSCLLRSSRFRLISSSRLRYWACWRR